MHGENVIETTMYIKPTNNEIYLHWISFTSVSRQIDTLKSHLDTKHIKRVLQLTLVKES